VLWRKGAGAVEAEARCDVWRRSTSRPRVPKRQQRRPVTVAGSRGHSWAEEDHGLAASASPGQRRTGGTGRWLGQGEGGSERQAREAHRMTRAAHEPVGVAAGAGGDDRSTWLWETGSGVGGHGRAFWLRPRASVSQSQPMEVITVTSIVLQPADGSYGNFHRLVLADGSYLFSIGFLRSRQKILS
jgi:hypothetical protein